MAYIKDNKAIINNGEYLKVLKETNHLKTMVSYLNDILMILKSREYTIGALIQKDLYEE